MSWAPGDCCQCVRGLRFKWAPSQTTFRRQLKQESWAPSQYPKRRLSVRSRKVSKPRDWYFNLALTFDRHIGSTAADVPVKFHSDRKILNTNLAASRLYEILRKDVFSDIETGPRCQHTVVHSTHVFRPHKYHKKYKAWTYTESSMTANPVRRL